MDQSRGGTMDLPGSLSCDGTTCNVHVWEPCVYHLPHDHLQRHQNDNDCCRHITHTHTYEVITLKTQATYDTQDAFSGSCLSFGIKKCIASCFLRRNERGEEL